MSETDKRLLERASLLQYYQNELAYLRRLGAEFGARYPKVAGRLRLEPGKCDDPHVERLLEGVAFLNARLHRRLDDDLPELSEALLGVLYPLHVRPVPSLSIVQLELDPELGRTTTGYQVARGAELRTRTPPEVTCRFRTCYDTELWPITVAAAEYGPPSRAGAGVRVGNAIGAVRVELKAFPGVRLADLSLDALRLHLAGDPAVADALYELLAGHVQEVVVRDPDRPSATPAVLPASAVQPAGFGPDDGLLPLPRRVPVAHRLLQELFVLPQKFHFIDVTRLGEAIRALGCGARAELVFLIAPFEQAQRRSMLEVGLSTDSIRLGCTPAVNLFAQDATPLRLAERRLEYVVRPDVGRRIDVETWAIDSVTLATPHTGVTREVAPLYGHRHRIDAAGVFWHAVRRQAPWRKDQGTEMLVSFADRSGGHVDPDFDLATLSLTCFNGDLPHQLQLGADERGEFELVPAGPVARVRSVLNPTAVVHPELGSALMWRLVSALSLNHLSLVEGGEEALQELLRLHNVGSSVAGSQQIDGLVAVRSAPAYARVAGPHGMAFARGRRIEVEFDEEQFAGSGVYLFASVLERFLALSTSMNSFTQLDARSRQRRRPIGTWPPRAGWRTLV